MRGYFEGTYGDLAMFSDAIKNYGLVDASPVEVDYDPFADDGKS